MDLHFDLLRKSKFELCNVFIPEEVTYINYRITFDDDYQYIFLGSKTRQRYYLLECQVKELIKYKGESYNGNNT